MVRIIFRKRDSKDTRNSENPDPPDPRVNSQILEIRQQLLTYIDQTTQYFSFFNTRLNKLQTEVEKLTAGTAESTGIDVDRFRQMEIKIAELSEDIAKINKAIYVNIRDCFEDIVDFIDEKTSKQAIKIFQPTLFDTRLNALHDSLAHMTQLSPSQLGDTVTRFREKLGFRHDHDFRVHFAPGERPGTMTTRKRGKA